jgi:hypothetical protein
MRLWGKASKCGRLLWLVPAWAALGLAGCHSMRLLPPAAERQEKDAPVSLPGKKSFRVSQYVFYSDFTLKRSLPIFQELADLRDQVHKELQLPAANTVVQVYLFEDRDRYERYMLSRYPDLPKRRAFFVAQPKGPKGCGLPDDLLVYTYWGDRTQQDLRHELTHALLHSVLKDVPLWLDEGLAEYFELPPSAQGINYPHVQQLCRGSEPFQPDMARLEQLEQVHDMTPAEYREAWAWVHWMLREPQAKAVLLGYLQQLRVTERPGPLYPRLAAVTSPEDALKKHLAKLDSVGRPVPTAQR